MTTKAMLKPNEVAEYLEKVRPMMDELKIGARVDVYGLGKYVKVTATDDDACTVRVELAHSSKWIRVEQIEYIHPY